MNTFVQSIQCCVYSLNTQRIDVFLNTIYSAYSRTFFQHSIKNQRVMINGSIITKHSHMLKHKDVISIILPQKLPIVLDQLQDVMPLQILFEHQDFMIINKPAGLSVHGAHSYKNKEITLVDILLKHYDWLSSVGDAQRPGIVHRLDKNTSGLIIIAKTNKAHTLFNTLFEKRSIKKTYQALVKGHMPQEGIIDYAITRDPHNPVKMTHRIKEGRAAFTAYKTLFYFDHHSFVELYPVTGRTHQIRVHCSAIGHPLEGDTTYGTQSMIIKRQALHAYQLSFNFLGQEYTFRAPLAEDIQKTLDYLQQS